MIGGVWLLCAAAATAANLVPGTTTMASAHISSKPASITHPTPLQTETEESDLEVVRARLVTRVLTAGSGDCQSLAHCDDTSAASPAAAARDARTLSAVGSWSDVNYTSRTRTSWSPEIHLNRMVNLAAVSRVSGNATLVASTLLAAMYWIKVDPQSDNWWWNQLSVPSRIGDAAVVLGDALPDGAVRDGLLAVMRRAVYTGRTGANLDDEVFAAMKRAAVTCNTTLMTAAFSRVWEEIRVVQPSGCIDPPPGTTGCPTDGIQADHSFHQHGPELLAGSYGEGYASDTLSFVALSAGTGYAVGSVHAELFAGLLLDGMQWMTVGSPAVWDWSVRGRDLGTTPRPVLFNTSQLTLLPSARGPELAAFAAAIAGNAPTAITGHRGFWDSDYSVVHAVATSGSRWVASVHMHSNRTVSARCVNGEGAMNEHTGDGMVYVYLKGTEYDGAFDLWDWRRLPGITADLGAPMLPCNYSDQLDHDAAQMNATGTVSDGVVGLSAMYLVTRNVSARKAVAMLQSGLVHLVAGAECAGGRTCGEIVTTIQNQPRAGLVVAGCNGSKVEIPDKTALKEYTCEWYWHGNIGYTVAPLPGRSTPMPVLVTNTDLFSLAVSHDAVGPVAAVHVLPSVALTDMDRIPSGGLNSRVLANTAAVQAVWDSARDQLLAVLWMAGTPHSIAAPPTASRLQISAVEASIPCTLSVAQSSDCGSFNVTVADLANNPAGGELTVRLTGDMGASVCSVPPCACVTEGDVTTVRLQLPTGFAAGQSVTVTCIPH